VLSHSPSLWPDQRPAQLPPAPFCMCTPILIPYALTRGSPHLCPRAQEHGRCLASDPALFQRFFTASMRCQKRILASTMAKITYIPEGHNLAVTDNSVSRQTRLVRSPAILHCSFLMLLIGSTHTRPQLSEVANACAAFEVNTPGSSTGWVSTGSRDGQRGHVQFFFASRHCAAVLF